MYRLTGYFTNSAVAGRAWSKEYPLGTHEEFLIYWSGVPQGEKDVSTSVSQFIITLLITPSQAFEKEGKAQVSITSCYSPSSG